MTKKIIFTSLIFYFTFIKKFTNKKGWLQWNKYVVFSIFELIGGRVFHFLEKDVYGSNIFGTIAIMTFLLFWGEWLGYYIVLQLKIKWWSFLEIENQAMATTNSLKMLHFLLP